MGTEPGRAPPGGGFGAAGPVPFGPISPPRPPRDRSPLVAVIVAGGLLLGFVFFLGWGQWKKAQAIRLVEARYNVGQIGKAVVTSYETRGALCPSAAPVPASFDAVRGRRYPTTPADWRNDPGWSCLGFEATGPLRYQYRFEREDPFFTIVAAGDLDGNDVRSTFELRGHVEPGTDGKPRIVLDRSIRESNPGE